MRKPLEHLYYGNLTLGEQVIAPNSKLLRAAGKAADCEEHPATLNMAANRRRPRYDLIFHSDRGAQHSPMLIVSIYNLF